MYSQIRLVFFFFFWKMLKLENVPGFELWAVPIRLLTLWLCSAQVWASPAGRAAAEGWVRGGSPGTEPPPRPFPRNSPSEVGAFGLRSSCALQLLDCSTESGEKAPDRLGLYVLDRGRHFERLRVFYVKHSRQSL